MSQAPAAIMVPIAINDFLTGTTTIVDLYVKLTDDKYVLLVRKGSKTDKNQLTQYKEKEVEYLYVTKQDFDKVAKQNIAIAGVLLTSDKLDAKRRTALISTAAGFVFNHIDQFGLSAEMYNMAKQVTDATVGLCEIHKDLASLVESLGRISDDVLRHALATSMTSVMIGQQMSWTNRITLEKLSLGGLLHNVGLKLIPQEIVSKPMMDMTPDENQHYETHPFKGMQLLTSLGCVPDDVVAIVYEHHENALGQGYPRRIRDVSIHPLAKVVSCAADFCSLTMKSPSMATPKNPREALVHIEYSMGQPHNKEVFKALQRLIEKIPAKKAG